MPTKNYSGFGKKASCFTGVVVADSRAPRDGKFIEKNRDIHNQGLSRQPLTLISTEHSIG